MLCALVRDAGSFPSVIPCAAARVIQSGVCGAWNPESSPSYFLALQGEDEGEGPITARDDFSCAIQDSAPVMPARSFLVSSRARPRDPGSFCSLTLARCAAACVDSRICRRFRASTSSVQSSGMLKEPPTDEIRHFYCRPCGEYHLKTHPHHAEMNQRKAIRQRASK